MAPKGSEQTATFDASLRVASGNGSMPNVDASSYDPQQRVMTHLLASRAVRWACRPVGANAMVDHVTA